MNSLIAALYTDVVYKNDAIIDVDK